MIPLTTDTKNTIAKIMVTVWIAFLAASSVWIARFALIHSGEEILGLGSDAMLDDALSQEIRLAVGMIAVAIIGGTCFIIKDFYKSIKNSNRFSLAWSDLRSGALSKDSFQKLIPIDAYIGRFNHTWIFWFLVQPILSSVLGMVAFFIARSGLGVVQGVGTGAITIQSIYMYATFTFLAGFSSHKFIAWLDRLADKIFSATIPEKKEAFRAEISAAASDDRENLRDDIASFRSKEDDIDLGVPGSPSSAGTSLPGKQIGRNDTVHEVEAIAQEIKNLSGTEGMKKIL